MTDNDMAELQALYRQGLATRIDALETAKKELHQSPQSIDSIRRIAHTLRGSGASYGFPEITESAAALEDAVGSDIVPCLDALLDKLREVASDGDTGRYTILIIEDNTDISQLIQLTLSAPNRDIPIAETVAQAETILDEQDVSLIILDLMLPDMDGRNLLVKLRESPITAATPVFVLSAQMNEQARSECFALGADECFKKPFDPKRLSTEVSVKLQRTAALVRETKRDAQTGLPNRPAFYETYNRELSQEKVNLSLALLELDRFDTQHKPNYVISKDAILKEAGLTISQSLREGDYIARLSGRVFGILFPDTPPDVAVGVLQKTLEEFRKPSPDHSQPVIFTAGVIEIQDHIPVQEAITMAEPYLYRAQSSGRYRIVSVLDELESVKRSILLVEDDDLTASIIKHRLTRDSFDVIHLTDGASALEEARRTDVSLAVLDVKMPVMDGFELLEELRKMPSYATLPIIILTSMGSEKDIARGFELGANDYILKPFSPVELLARIHRLLKD